MCACKRLCVCVCVCLYCSGGVCLLCVPRGAVSLAPPKPGADTAALQRGAALGRHRDPAVPVAPQTRAAAAQVHQDRSPVRDCVIVTAGSSAAFQTALLHLAWLRAPVAFALMKGRSCRTNAVSLHGF